MNVTNNNNEHLRYLVSTVGGGARHTLRLFTIHQPKKTGQKMNFKLHLESLLAMLKQEMLIWKIISISIKKISDAQWKILETPINSPSQSKVSTPTS